MALSIELKRLKFPGNVVEAAVIGESHYEGVDCTTTSLSCHLTATSAPLHGTVCILLNKKRFDVGSVILKYHRKQDYWISDMYCRPIDVPMYQPYEPLSITINILHKKKEIPIHTYTLPVRDFISNPEKRYPLDISLNNSGSSDQGNTTMSILCIYSNDFVAASIFSIFSCHVGSLLNKKGQNTFSNDEE